MNACYREISGGIIRTLSLMVQIPLLVLTSHQTDSSAVPLVLGSNDLHRRGDSWCLLVDAFEASLVKMIPEKKKPAIFPYIPPKSSAKLLI